MLRNRKKSCKEDNSQTKKNLSLGQNCDLLQLPIKLSLVLTIIKGGRERGRQGESPFRIARFCYHSLIINVSV